MKAMFEITGGLLVLVFWLGALLSMLNHIIICINDERILLLLVGLLFFPVGVIHGAGAFLGIFG